MNIQIKNLPNGISIVKINEPKTYNALSFQNLTDLIKAFKKLERQKARPSKKASPKRKSTAPKRKSKSPAKKIPSKASPKK